MRNPFRRQTETAAPTLRERAANLRASIRPIPAAPAALPAPGSVEARAAWEDACREHSKRTQALPRYPELVRPEGGFWTTDTLSEALNFGAIKPAEFARLYPLASEFTLGLEQIGHDLNVHALFALAHAVEFPKEGEAAPGDNAFPDAPADLADACLWAIRHRAWADRLSSVQDWSDERGDAELNRTNTVFTRAINEPSTSLREITAKAALALEDFERFSLRPGHEPDDGTRIVHTVLREIVGVGREAGASVALTPTAFDFGPDAHIAELAAEFCEVYAANVKADREHMAERMPEAEWLPYYAEAKRLMEKLEATEPKTMLGMALKCLGPIGAAGYNAPADRTERQEDAWDRLGTQFVDAVLADTLAPLPASRQPDRDLCRESFNYAYGLDLLAVPLDCLLRLIDVFHREAEVLSDVSQEVRFYADANIRLQNDGGEIIEAESNRLGCLRDVCVEEVARRTPKTDAERDAILVSRVHHEMLCEMKIRSRALLAEIREAWGEE